MNLLAIKALLGNSRRSLHVIYAVAFSVALIYSSFTVAESFVMRVNILTEGYTFTDTFFIVEPGGSISSTLIEASTLDFLGDTVLVSPIVKCKFIVDDEGNEFDLWGVDFEAFESVRGLWISGVIPDSVSEVLVGTKLADVYGVTVGSSITMNTVQGDVSLIVSGVFRSNSHYDEGFLASHETALLIRPEMNEMYSIIEVKTEDAKTLIEEFQVPGLELLPSTAMSDYLGGLVKDIRRDLYMVSIIIAFLALLTVSHTMYKIVGDSLNELMILRSIGHTRPQILRLIVLNSLLLSLSGAFLGLFLGNLIINGSSITVFLVLRSVYLPVVFNPETYIFCIFLAVSVGLLGGLLSIVIKRPNRESYGALKSI
jgi:putative ABC transport system permease protein